MLTRLKNNATKSIRPECIPKLKKGSSIKMAVIGTMYILGILRNELIRKNIMKHNNPKKHSTSLNWNAPNPKVLIERPVNVK